MNSDVKKLKKLLSGAKFTGSVIFCFLPLLFPHVMLRSVYFCIVLSFSFWSVHGVRCDYRTASVALQYGGA